MVPLIPPRILSMALSVSFYSFISVKISQNIIMFSAQLFLTNTIILSTSLLKNGVKKYFSFNLMILLNILIIDNIFFEDVGHEPETDPENSSK